MKKFTQLCYLHYSSPATADKADVVLHQQALSILPSTLTHGHQQVARATHRPSPQAGPPVGATVTWWSLVALGQRGPLCAPPSSKAHGWWPWVVRQLCCSSLQTWRACRCHLGTVRHLNSICLPRSRTMQGGLLPAGGGDEAR